MKNILKFLILVFTSFNIAQSMEQEQTAEKIFLSKLAPHVVEGASFFDEIPPHILEKIFYLLYEDDKCPYHKVNMINEDDWLIEQCYFLDQKSFFLIEKETSPLPDECGKQLYYTKINPKCGFDTDAEFIGRTEIKKIIFLQEKYVLAFTDNENPEIYQVAFKDITRVTKIDAEKAKSLQEKYPVNDIEKKASELSINKTLLAILSQRAEEKLHKFDYTQEKELNFYHVVDAEKNIIATVTGTGVKLFQATKFFNDTTLENFLEPFKEEPLPSSLEESFAATHSEQDTSCPIS